MVELLSEWLPRPLKRLVKAFVPEGVLASRELLRWRSRNFVAPAPFLVKKKVLVRDAATNVTWVETGTFRGDMTHELAKSANHVITIEPEPALYQAAKRRFLGFTNVTTLLGTSEDVFPIVLAQVKSPVRFWLDGHFSAGVTFQGDSDTPIRAELEAIGGYLTSWNDVSIYIDDVRCFDPSVEEYKDYPRLAELVDWAQSHGLVWIIEHDIFIARNK